MFAGDKNHLLCSRRRVYIYLVWFREIAMLKISRPVCSRCNNSFATRQSLWNHKQRCRGMQYDEQNNRETFHDYRKDDYQIFGRKGSADGATNAKVQKSVNKIENEDDDDIPYFDGDEFSGKIPTSRETLNKMMKMLKIPEECWDRIATAEEQDARNSLLRSEEELPLSEQSRSLFDIKITRSLEFKLERQSSSSPGDEIFTSDDDDDDDDDDDNDKCFEFSKAKNLLNRFKVLHRQLLKDRKQQNATELITILGTLLKRGLIDHAGYRKAFNKVMDDQRECIQ